MMSMGSVTPGPPRMLVAGGGIGRFFPSLSREPEGSPEPEPAPAPEEEKEEGPEEGEPIVSVVDEGEGPELPPVVEAPEESEPVPMDVAPSPSPLLPQALLPVQQHEPSPDPFDAPMPAGPNYEPEDIPAPGYDIGPDYRAARLRAAAR